MIRELEFVDAAGNVQTQSLEAQEARLVDGNDNSIVPIAARNVERKSEREKSEATTQCGQRRVADDGQGRVKYTVEAVYDEANKNLLLQNNNGETLDFYNDICACSAESVFIKELAVMQNNELQSVMVNGVEKKPYEAQLTLEVDPS